MSLSRFAACVALAAAPVLAFDEVPVEGLVNFETPHVHPLDLTPDGNRLLAVNSALGTLEVFDAEGETLVHLASIPVGLDPVSVRARDNARAWVVNHVSDTVSIVDLKYGRVVRTLQTANEPADVIFAGDPLRAFVSCSEPSLVQVFDLGMLTTPPISIALGAEEPRALAKSPDGRFVHVAFFESGNGTTSVNGRLGPITTGEGVGAANVVSRPEGPYGGVNPAPNDGTGFRPPRNPAAGPPPPQSIIVRQDGQGAWFDDNGGDWAIFVSGALATLTRRQPGWKLPDRDVARIDTDTLQVKYQERLMTIVMALATNPATGEVTAVGTEAFNDIRFEPNLTGRFVQVRMASFAPGEAAAIEDLNPHLDYSAEHVSAKLRARSIGDPRGICWRDDGSSAFVTGMGSNNVIEIDPQGRRLRTIVVGEGPTGIVLDAARERVYVLNKFAGSVSSFEANDVESAVEEVAFYDPTPEVIKQGRRFLYNTHLSSRLGQIACGSCHVDARTDRLAWDLGDPSGAPGARHPMKGPMMTQSLQDIVRHPNMHWRGDRDDLFAFNPAFVSLMGAESEIAVEDMAAFEAFIDTIHFPPSPFRNLDNSRPSSLELPDGRIAPIGNLLSSQCLGCHLTGSTRSDTLSVELDQDFIPPTFHGMYDRIGYWPDGPHEPTSGFGFFHDGADPLFVTTRGPGFTAEMLVIDGPGVLTGNSARKDVHAAVGRQLTLRGPLDAEQALRLQAFLRIVAGDVHAGLIAKTGFETGTRGFYWTADRFQSDRGHQILEPEELQAIAEAGTPVTYTMVAAGTEIRLGVDRDNDGVFDGDQERLVSIQAHIAAGEDDAEEEAFGGMRLSDPVLELAFGPAGWQLVGLRFTGVAVPQGARVVSAFIEFHSAAAGTGNSKLFIQAHASDAAPAFSLSSPLSSLPLTAARSGWSPPDWEQAGLAGPEQRSADLSPVLQEIVDRPGWSGDGEIALVLSGKGPRAASAFEDSSAAAAVLHLVYLPRPEALTDAALTGGDGSNR